MIKYNVIARKDPRDPNAIPKYHPVLKSVQSINEDYIARELAEKSSLSEGDVMSIITNLFKMLPKELAHGRTVRLGSLGTFSLTV